MNDETRDVEPIVNFSGKGRPSSFRKPTRDGQTEIEKLCAMLTYQIRTREIKRKHEKEASVE